MFNLFPHNNPNSFYGYNDNPYHSRPHVSNNYPGSSYFYPDYEDQLRLAAVERRRQEEAALRRQRAAEELAYRRRQEELEWRRRLAMEEERRRMIQEEMLRRQANVHRVPSHFEAPSRLRSSVYERDPSPLRASPTTAGRAVSPEERAFVPAERTPTPEQRAPTPEERAPTPSERVLTPVEPTPTPPEPTPIPSSPTEAEESAASTLQTHYRTRLALRSIRSIIHSFHLLKSSFSFPPVLDFQPSSSHSPSSPPKLAYTPRNTPLHAYTEALSKLLLQLDGVESYGVRRVREARKAVVMGVEDELERVERGVGEVWERMQCQVEHLEEVVEEKQPLEEVVEEKQPLEEVVEEKQPLEEVVEEKQPLEEVVEEKQPLEEVVEEKQPLEEVVEERQPVETVELEKMPVDESEDTQTTTAAATSPAPAPEPMDEADSEEVWEMVTLEDSVAPTATLETQPASQSMDRSEESMDLGQESMDLDEDLSPSPLLDSATESSDFDTTAMHVEIPGPVSNEPLASASAPVVGPVSV